MQSDLSPSSAPEHSRRRGAAAVELAVVLSVLAYVFVGVLDFARFCRAYTIVTWCARDGALYGSASASNSTNTTAIQAAAQADAGGLSPLPSITSTTGSATDSKSVSYNYVQVTSSYTFNTISTYPGIPSSLTLSRTVRMEVFQ
jgi:Flp pilus assembly protein TadG